MHFGEYHFKTSADKAAAMDDVRSPANGMTSSDYIHPGDDDDCWLDDDDESIGAFPPKLSNYVDANTSIHPTVTVDKARSDIFSQYKCEYGFITEMIKKLPGGAEDDEEGGIDKLINLLLGQNSKVYLVFYDTIGLPYHKFSQSW